MDWSVHNALSNARSERAAKKAARSAEKAHEKTDDFSSELKRLQSRVDRLALACQSMWELVKDRTDLTEEDIEAKMLEIDLRDGRADNKIGTTVSDCPACGRRTNSTRDLCVMCGAPLTREHKFGN